MDEFRSMAGSLVDAEAQDVVSRSLAAVRRHLGMEVAYISEFVGGRGVFRAVDAPGLEHLIEVGQSRSLDDVYCQHILEGRLPNVIADTSREPLCVSMPITAAVPIGSHVSVPIRRLDGSVYGMFCCLSQRPNHTLNERDLEVVEMFASLSADRVNSEIAERVRRAEIEARLSEVMRDGRFRMLSQPIFELGQTRPAGFEALCRFAGEPYRSPDKWFAEAETVGLGVELELAAIAAALGALPLLPPDIYISVNAAPATVVSGRLAEAFAGQPLERIVLEITEHAVVGDWAGLTEQARLWQFRGVTLAIDDAGAGYSGLQQIIRLKPDVIKLDMSLTSGFDTDPAKRSLATAMVHFAGETGAVIVAEGIETAGELAVLEALGVQRGQGWHLGKPVELADAIALCAPVAEARVA